jgi:hypothetical protein
MRRTEIRETALGITLARVGTYCSREHRTCLFQPNGGVHISLTRLGTRSDFISELIIVATRSICLDRNLPLTLEI